MSRKKSFLEESLTNGGALQEAAALCWLFTVLSKVPYDKCLVHSELPHYTIPADRVCTTCTEAVKTNPYRICYFGRAAACSVYTLIRPQFACSCSIQNSDWAQASVRTVMKFRAEEVPVRWQGSCRMLLFDYPADSDDNWRQYMAKSAAHFREFYDILESRIQGDPNLRGFIHPVSLVAMIPTIQ